MSRKTADISNSFPVKNADGLLSKKPAKMEVQLVDKSKTRLPSNKYKVSYWFVLQKHMNYRLKFGLWY